MPITGYTENTADDISVDAGILAVGTVLLGASRGGFRFTPGITWREFKADGISSPVVRGHSISRYDPVISGKLLELNETNVLFYEPGSTVTDDVGPPHVITVVPVDARGPLAAAAYVTDLYLYTERGDGTFWEIHFPKALCRRYDQTTGDDNEVEADVEFIACLDFAGGASLTDCPYTRRIIDALPTFT